MTKQSQNDLDNHYPMNCSPSAAISNGPTFQVEIYVISIMSRYRDIRGVLCHSGQYNADITSRWVHPQVSFGDVTSSIRGRLQTVGTLSIIKGNNI